ncbi:hypothetical protein BKA61DRAFT_691923, partial [Leptodontidium sp. MPI-SDFR-AT-0119]
LIWLDIRSGFTSRHDGRQLELFRVVCVSGLTYKDPTSPHITELLTHHHIQQSNNLQHHSPKPSQSTSTSLPLNPSKWLPFNPSSPSSPWLWQPMLPQLRSLLVSQTQETLQLASSSSPMELSTAIKVARFQLWFPFSLHQELLAQAHASPLANMVLSPSTLLPEVASSRSTWLETVSTLLSRSTPQPAARLVRLPQPTSTEFFAL